MFFGMPFSFLPQGAISEFKPNIMIPLKHIGIVGGSIAGCSMAIELSRAGYEVTLFERTGDELKDRGAGIGVPPSVIDSFKERDILDIDLPFFEIRTFLRLNRTHEEPVHGRVAWDQPGHIYCLNWGYLYRNLRKRVPGSIYRNGMKVEAVLQKDEQEAIICLADGSERKFDLVICADGYRSIGRQYLFPESKINYAGYVLWRGVLEEDQLEDSELLEGKMPTPGYREGHAVFYFVPGKNGTVEKGKRLVNWAMYVRVREAALMGFLQGKNGSTSFGSIAPGNMPKGTEGRLKALARETLPDYFSDIISRSEDTFVQAIFDCTVPAYRKGRICLSGDAGSLARPHSGNGAFKSMTNAHELAQALLSYTDLDAALEQWSQNQTQVGNNIVRFGNQLGRALVTEIPDWSVMSEDEMKAWFQSIVTVKNEILEED